MLGKNLKEFREKRFLTIRDLASHSGVSTSTITRIENDSTSRVYPTTIKKLAGALGISVKTLTKE